MQGHVLIADWYLFIYYETRTKVHEKEKRKKHNENTVRRKKIQKEIQKKQTHHEKHITWRIYSSQLIVYI